MLFRSEAEDEVRDIILFHRISLIIEGEAVGFHIIKPHLVRPAGIGLGEDEDGSGDAGVGFEDAGGHGNHSLELVMLDKFFADGFVRFAAAEEDAVGDDAGAAATLLQRAEEENPLLKYMFNHLSINVLGDLASLSPRVETPLTKEASGKKPAAVLAPNFSKFSNVLPSVSDRKSVV